MSVYYRIPANDKTASKERSPASPCLSIANLFRWLRDTDNQNVFAVAFVALFLGFYSVSHYGLGIMGIRALSRGYGENPPWQVEAERSDPPTGKLLNLPMFSTLEGKQISLPLKGQPTALVFTANNTSPDTHDSMRATETMAQRLPKVKFYLVVMTGDAAAARSIWQASRLTVPLVVDSGAEAAVKANAIFNFRRYLFDSQGRLIYLSQRDQKAEAVTRDMERVLGASPKTGG
jgi:hypothetical protein